MLYLYGLGRALTVKAGPGMISGVDSGNFQKKNLLKNLWCCDILSTPCRFKKLRNLFLYGHILLQMTSNEVIYQNIKYQITLLKKKCGITVGGFKFFFLEIYSSVYRCTKLNNIFLKGNYLYSLYFFF